MEGNYRQKSIYLAFILIIVTSLFFRLFTLACHVIVFTFMLIQFHFSLIFFYSLYLWIASLSCIFLFLFVLILFCISCTNVNSITHTIYQFQQRWIQVVWILCCIVTSGGSVCASIAVPLYKKNNAASLIKMFWCFASGQFAPITICSNQDFFWGGARERYMYW